MSEKKENMKREEDATGKKDRESCMDKTEKKKLRRDRNRRGGKKRQGHTKRKIRTGKEEEENKND